VIERELKIPVPKVDEIRRRVVAAGGTRLTARMREVNVLFDTARGDLATSGCVLRVRTLGERNILTFKGPSRFEGFIKERQEIETEVTSAHDLIALLERLGYAPWIRYEKDRESWQLGTVRVDLDHTPIGDFVEIEGPSDRLLGAARTLDLDPSHAVLGSYVELWRRYREQHPEVGRDMVFSA